MYLAVDISSSMAGDRIAAVEQAIARLSTELLSNPLLGERVRVGIVAFHETAEVVVPLSDLTELRRLPRIRARGVARYGPLFQLLARVLERDRRVLLAADNRVSSPFVFLITDGVPVDSGWYHSYAEYRDRTRARLILVAIGVAPDDEGLRELRPVRALHWQDAHDMGLSEWLFDVMDEYAHELTTSVVVRRPESRVFDPPPADPDFP
ncbi:vWA domain-containing protein [Actinoplanes sp. RD1]|uniref:vWA domain-containing protein n=1 Tax=Actinoplanes sp. RD1 TaxID=3064538 RepID=UPI002741069F|nr:VWA domain-containing protein [Actinoplanes sp. RD1]